MQDLINREDAIAALENHRKYESDFGYCECKSDMIQILRQQPRVDSKKIFANWEPNYKGEYYCTNCGAECDVDLFCNPLLNQFCGNCGAKMEDNTND